MDAKINRNDPCPCGSGKKYKKCCGLKEMHSVQKRLTVQRGLRVPGILGVQKNLAESVIKVLTDGRSSAPMMPFLPGSSLSGSSGEGPDTTIDGQRELIEQEIVVEDKTLEGKPDDLLPPPKNPSQ